MLFILWLRVNDIVAIIIVLKMAERRSWRSRRDVYRNRRDAKSDLVIALFTLLKLNCTLRGTLHIYCHSCSIATWFSFYIVHIGNEERTSEARLMNVFASSSYLVYLLK